MSETIICCSECGIRYAVPEPWRKSRIEDKATFYCPNGHTQKYGYDWEADRLRRELDRAKQNAAYLNDRIKQEQNEKIVLKGQITKLKKRVASGVCPCCNRSFVELQKHIATKHPEFRAEDVQHENIVSILKSKT